MAGLTAGLVISLQCLACLGLGSLALRALGIDQEIRLGDRLAWSFGIGFGLLGWVLFMVGVVGIYRTDVLIALLLASSLGCVLLRSPSADEPATTDPSPGLSATELLLILGIVTVGLFDFLEALAPPSDADSLAYHFALPKLFLNEGRIVFVPIAVQGAAPLLIQMTYLPALALGGEIGLTSWTMVSGWAVVGLFYALCRSHVSRSWSLAACLVFLTLPIVQFTAGSGHVEPRMAGFVILSAQLLVVGLRSARIRYVCAAGIVAGFLIGSKFTGLVLATALASTILFYRHRFSNLVVFCATATAIGWQWYLWNWLHTGDPIFPSLFQLVGTVTPALWDQNHHDYMRQMIESTELVVPRSLLWMLIFPFAASIQNIEGIETARVGLGPAAMLLLPFAVAGFLRFRGRLERSPLPAYFWISFAYYALWFFLGASQRLRHFLPVFPLLFVCLLVAAERWSRAAEKVRVLGLAMAAVILIQLGGSGLFAVKFARHLLADEPREAFLTRNVIGYGAMPWIQNNLDSNSKLYFTRRELNYLIDTPVHLGHWALDAVIDIGPRANDPLRLFAQLRSQGITHLLVPLRSANSAPSQGGYLGLEMWRALVDSNCARIEAEFESRSRPSRTLPALGESTFRQAIIRLTPDECQG